MVLAINSKEKSIWWVSLSFRALLLTGSAGTPAGFEREARTGCREVVNEVNTSACYAGEGARVPSSHVDLLTRLARAGPN